MSTRRSISTTRPFCWAGGRDHGGERPRVPVSDLPDAQGGAGVAEARSDDVGDHHRTVRRDVPGYGRGKASWMWAMSARCLRCGAGNEWIQDCLLDAGGRATLQVAWLTMFIAVCAAIVVREFFDARLSWDGVIAAIGILGSAIIVLVAWLRRRYALRAWNSGDPFNYRGHRRSGREVWLQAGTKSTILVWIKPRVTTRFGEIHAVCESTSWWPLSCSPFSQASPHVIEVTGMRDCDLDRPIMREIRDRLIPGPDTRGGYIGRYDPPSVTTKNGSRWIEVQVCARKPWRGFLSILNEGDNPRRQYARVRIKIVSELPPMLALGSRPVTSIAITSESALQTAPPPRR